MKPKINWFSVEGKQAVSSIFSHEKPDPDTAIASALDVRPGRLALGFMDESEHLCSVVVIKEAESLETLAWIATYTPEAFPLSQSVRVLGVEEFYILDDLRVVGRALPHEPIWPSIILGEMLSQGQPGVTPDKVPVSRAISTFSFAQARTTLLYKEGSAASQRCVDRLRQMEGSSLFIQRPLSIDVLEMIWSFADDGLTQPRDVQLVIDAVMSALETGAPRKSSGIHPDYIKFGLDIDAISTGPHEQRIVEFERVTGRLVVACNGNRELWLRAPLHLAAFTFMVGGGTSHLHLLNDFGRTFPGVYAWFGLFAALSGQKSWDSKWLRAASSIERLLRPSFNFQDPPASDLCWIEYEWIRQQKEPLAWIAEIPQLSTQILSVEINPGVICQMRLSDRSSNAAQLNELTNQVNFKIEFAMREIEQQRKVQSALVDGVKEAMRTLQAALAGVSNSASNEAVQGALFESSASESPRGSSPKKKSSKRKTRRKE